MKLHKKQFLGIKQGLIRFEEARVVIAPFGYEGGVSYGQGTAEGPEAVIDASYHLEIYDEELDTEPSDIGICTVEAIKMPSEGAEMVQAIFQRTKNILSEDKFIVSVGGDHSITTGYCKALVEKYVNLSVIQIDAHADLRHSYQSSIYSHASAMARIREMTPNTLQLGIRSMSKPEADLVKDEQLALYTMDMIRRAEFSLESVLENLPEPVFITFDVDAFDWSVVRSTGTPEPGGLLWDEAIGMLRTIFSAKNVVGFDVVELAHDRNDPNSAFAVAKLIYKMIGYKFYSSLLTH
jgi:agmatinase